MRETRAHDPVQRLNAHHLHEVLAIARVFGGAADAVSARVATIDDEQITIETDGPAGHDVVTVRFADTLDDLEADRSLRLRFRNLARRATAT